ncbi:hypothetical protein OG470_06190 [Micromonospora sp. NBC_00389]|uniref:hypothetical protein n=1 Tax=Micromonospora sp. NBC_00389 TaxID=2903586 RepID=UPI002E1E3993
MGWLHGPRILQTYERGFEASSVRLNVDDINDIISWIRAKGFDPIHVLGAPIGQHGDLLPDKPIQDLSTTSAAEVGQLKIWSEMDAADQQQWRRIDMRITPDGLTVSTIAPSQECWQEVLGEIRRMVEHAERGPMPVGRKVQLILRAQRIVVGLILLGLWTWLTLEWRSVPGALLTAIVAALSASAAKIDTAAVFRFVRRHSRIDWLDQFSRRELYERRANIKRDRKVAYTTAFPTAIVAATVGALLTAGLKMWLG